MTSAEPLFIIPARGGSKGIPHKNVRLLCGRPLIAYTIEAALEACQGRPERVILSTDDQAIAEAARECGLPDVPYMRPASLGGDTVGSREVMLDVMDWADSRGMAYDSVVLLQPTSPLRTAKDILGAMAMYDPAETDMVVSVSPAKSNPYYTCFEADPVTGYLHISKGDGLYTRRQDIPQVWEYNGAVYVIRPEALRAMPLGAFPRRVAYPMEASRSLDLDTLEDWALAEVRIGHL